jgi:hypothetical protein
MSETLVPREGLGRREGGSMTALSRILWRGRGLVAFGLVAAVAAGCGGALGPKSGGAGQGGSSSFGTGGTGEGGSSFFGTGGTPGEGGTTGNAGYPGGSFDASYGFGGGAGGMAGGSGGGDGGGSTCTTTFSGAFSVTMSCRVGLSYQPTLDQFGFGIDGDLDFGSPIPGTGYTWQGGGVNVAGLPRVGTFDQTNALTGRDEVNVPTNLVPSNGPDWGSFWGHDGGAHSSLSITLTSFGGPTTNQWGVVVYDSPHGSLTATLVDDVRHMPDLIETATF